jgi:hypothetical protein
MEGTVDSPNEGRPGSTVQRALRRRNDAGCSKSTGVAGEALREGM